MDDKKMFTQDEEINLVPDAMKEYKEENPDLREESTVEKAVNTVVETVGGSVVDKINAVVGKIGTMEEMLDNAASLPINDYGKKKVAEEDKTEVAEEVKSDVEDKIVEEVKSDIKDDYNEIFGNDSVPIGEPLLTDEDITEDNSVAEDVKEEISATEETEEEVTVEEISAEESSDEEISPAEASSEEKEENEDVNSSRRKVESILAKESHYWTEKGKEAIRADQADLDEPKEDLYKRKFSEVTDADSAEAQFIMGDGGKLKALDLSERRPYKNKNKKGDNPIEEYHKKGESKKKKRAFIDEVGSWIVTFAVAILIALVLKNYVIINATVPTGSMENTIMPGDDILGFRLAYKFSEVERGDIVIFKYPDNEKETFIKRVIGLPGETVEISDAHIYIDGSSVPLEEDYLKEAWFVENDGYTFEVPENSYLMLGDNRNDSKDSRYWENKYVTKDKIIGKAELIYFPFEDFSSLN